MTEYDTLRVDGTREIATIHIKPADQGYGSGGDAHWDLAEALSELRSDLSVRVIIITGEGDNLYVPPSHQHYGEMDSEGQQTAYKRLADPKGAFKTFTGVLRAHYLMATIEKPIIAKVNGDAVGFGASIAWSSDFIVAEESSVFSDVHMSMDEVASAFEWGVAPGDGGAATIPLHMPPAMANEYLMFGEKFIGAELAEKGIINRAVPSDELDDTVDEYVERLLQRSAIALAWTKRVARKHYLPRLNLTLGESAGYEMLNFVHIALTGSDQRSLQ